MTADFPPSVRATRPSRARSTRARLALFALLLAPLGCGDKDDSPTGPAGAVTLTSGTPVTVSGAANSEKLYRITVPSGATSIAFQTRGGTGDLDFYVRAGQVPTPQTVTCYSDRMTNEEDCQLGNPQAGVWYILLHGFEAYAGAVLTVTVTGGA